MPLVMLAVVLVPLACWILVGRLREWVPRARVWATLPAAAYLMYAATCLAPRAAQAGRALLASIEAWDAALIDATIRLSQAVTDPQTVRYMRFGVLGGGAVYTLVLAASRLTRTTQNGATTRESGAVTPSNRATANNTPTDNATLTALASMGSIEKLLKQLLGSPRRAQSGLGSTSVQEDLLAAIDEMKGDIIAVLQQGVTASVRDVLEAILVERGILDTRRTQSQRPPLVGAAKLKGLASHKKVAKASTVDEAQRNAAANFTEEALKEMLEQKRGERRSQNNPFLTDAEKALPLSELYRKWKQENQQRRREKLALHKYDFEDLGELTTEEKSLPRAQIRRIIRDRKTALWVKRMTEQGREVTKCEGCGSLYTKDSVHQCLVTPWKTTTTREGRGKGVVITQTDGALLLKQRPFIDEDKLQKANARLQQLNRELQRQKDQIQALEAVKASKDDPSSVDNKSVQEPAALGNAKSSEPEDQLMEEPANVAHLGFLNDNDDNWCF